jgi:hypothetical protein
MARRGLCSIGVSMLVAIGALGLAPGAGAASTTQLVLSQGAAFAILGHSCGGIQEHAYATGFGLDGYPAGDVYMQTRCGGSGRGGGYKSTTYSAWATVTWDWFGDTRSSARLEAPGELSSSFSAEDGYGDRVYDTESGAYLETTSPPLAAPEAPTEVTAAQSNIEVGERLELRFQISWTPAASTAELINSSTITATPVGSSAPVLTTTVSGNASSALIGPLQPSTTYRITVTDSDREGTSASSNPIEARSPNEDGEVGGGEPPGPPDFGRCVKVAGGGEFTTATCQLESPGATGSYEWVPGVLNGAFSSSIKPTTLVKLETSASREKVTCTGERSSGEITGAKTVGSVTIMLSGCESLGGACTTAGLAEGELETASLQGVLGIERVTERLGKEVVHTAIALQPEAGSGPFLEYTCATSGLAVINGSVIAPVVSGKMLKTTTFKLVASAGRQKPEAFEGGVREVLTNGPGEQVGFSLTATQSNEEAFEVNAVA